MKPSSTTTLTALWAALTFIPLWFAREIDALFGGWPVSYWWAAQAALVLYVLILYFNNRFRGLPFTVGTQQSRSAAKSNRMLATDDTKHYSLISFHQHKSRLHSIFIWYLFGLFVFLIAMASLEEAGMTRQWIGVVFLFASISLYAIIGLVCRTTDMDAFYVANRRVPPVYNGMASAADWMSAATFVSLTGGLYLQGFSGTRSAPGGLAYILGWTGGFVLLGLWLAPQLRRLRLYTLPDFFRVRFGHESFVPLYFAAAGTILCSFTYLVAQIYGVGLITSRLTGVQFEIGIMLGLGGVLICSFLGGMRAVTWTQVAQYVILLLAFLIPTSWLAYKQLGNPIAITSYTQQLKKITKLEQELSHDPAEQEVRQWYADQTQTLGKKIADPAQALHEERTALNDQLTQLRQSGAPLTETQAVRRILSNLPSTTEQARQQWQQELERSMQLAKPLAGIPPHTQPYQSTTKTTNASAPKDEAILRGNFIALVICLVAGTMGLPHVLIRFYTTPTVSGARKSVAWTLFFITLLYLSIPAMATLAKFEVMTNLVGLPYENLPAWMSFWSQIDPKLLSYEDVNHDGLLQFGELHIGTDVLVLAAPELGGLPFVVSGLVAAGGLAAALSTADGLLLTIGNAIAYDIKSPTSWTDNTPKTQHQNQASIASENKDSFEKREPNYGHGKRVLSSKLALLVIALLASALASFKPANILELVSASFSFAASIFTPALLFGLYSKNLSARACSTAMLMGLVVTLSYMLLNSAWLSAYWHLPAHSFLIAGIHPVAAGVFGMLASAGIMLLSLMKNHLTWTHQQKTTPVSNTNHQSHLGF